MLTRRATVETRAFISVGPFTSGSDLGKTFSFVNCVSGSQTDVARSQDEASIEADSAPVRDGLVASSTTIQENLSIKNSIQDIGRELGDVSHARSDEGDCLCGITAQIPPFLTNSHTSASVLLNAFKFATATISSV